MNFFKPIMLTILLGVAMTGCIQRQTVSQRWINEPHLDYPADRFLVGVASGQTCDDAVDRAIARISQQIEVRVNATEQRRSLVHSVSSLGDSGSFTFDSEVRLVSETTLLGVEIVETVHHRSGSCSARAVLDLERSIVLYDEAISLRQTAIRSSLERADSAESRWIEFIETAQALREAIDRDVLAIARGVLKSRIGAAQPQMTIVVPMLVDRYESLRKQISVSVVPIGDCPVLFIDSARADLMARDFPLKPDYFGALQIRIGWETKTERTFDPRWWSSRWRLSVTLYDADRGVTIAGNTSQGGAAYGLTEDAARAQAQSDAVNSLAEAIERLMDFPGKVSAP